MPQYFVAGYSPDDFDPSQVERSEWLARSTRSITEMIAAGVQKI